LQNVVRKGTAGWKKIKKEFGDDVLLSSGEIDRARLGQIVFSDPDKRQKLNRYFIYEIIDFSSFPSVVSI
jgi:dephospho-CoA kinase